MDNILLSAALAFIITFFATPVIIKIAQSKKLFDEPDERKVHKSVIPTLGGLGIFAGFIVATLMGAPFAAELQYFAAAAIVIFFLGLKDDILGLSANKKFIGQLIAAGIVIRFGGVHLDNMHGFFGLNEIPYIAGVALTVFTIIVITNSFNLIDGIDGLAASLGLLTTFVFGCYFYYADALPYSVMAFSLTGATLAFLIFNFSPARIFMGDTGSLLIGLVNSILVIKFINLAGTTGKEFSFYASPAIGFAVLIIPLFDTLRVFGLRILDRRSPFSPDRIHIHHFLLDLGFSHRKITLSLAATTLVFVAIAYFLRNLGTTVSVAVLLMIATSLTGLVYMLRQRKLFPSKAKEIAQEKKIHAPRKIYSFATPEPVEMD